MRMTGADFRDVSPNVTLELIQGHAPALTPLPECENRSREIASSTRRSSQGFLVPIA